MGECWRGMSTRGQRLAETERANKKRPRRELGPVRHYEKKWVPFGHIMVYKWVTTEERTEGVLKPKTEPLYRSAVAAAQGRVTRGASELIEDVEASQIERALELSKVEAERQAIQNSENDKGPEPATAEGGAFDGWDGEDEPAEEDEPAQPPAETNVEPGPVDEAVKAE